MTTSSLQYKAHELRVYAQQEFPPLRDPYASGDKRFSAALTIDTVPADATATRRYLLDFSEVPSPTAEIAVARALQIGRNIIDDKVFPEKL